MNSRFEDQIDALEQVIGYRFTDRSDISLALTHPSYSNERDTAGQDYQRLEFLGDAVLGMLLAELLYQRMADVGEGVLSRSRSQLAGQGTLAEVARGLGLGEFIRLGRGEEQCRGREKDSILADVFEAVLAAVYRDGGLAAARSLIIREFGRMIEGDKVTVRCGDAKSDLQEQLSAHGYPPPTYHLHDVSGSPHAPLFRFQVLVDSEIAGEGEGNSKKAAQQAAAVQALVWLSANRAEPVR